LIFLYHLSSTPGPRRRYTMYDLLLVC
jgi:hypothetical protein